MMDLNSSGVLRDFELLAPAWTIATARARLADKQLGVVVDEAGKPLTCLRKETMLAWPSDPPLEALRTSWPPILVLPEHEAISVAAVASFFRDKLIHLENLVAIVLVDKTGHATGLLQRKLLILALADPNMLRKVRRDMAIPATWEPATDLMLTRYGHVDFPREAMVEQQYALKVSISREAIPDVLGQVELGLTADAWPLKVAASLVGVLPEDFRIVGPAHGVIEVPRDADSPELAFTLIPQSQGKKIIRVRFEQGNAYLGTAFIHTEITATPKPVFEPCKVVYRPTLSNIGVTPDVTIYIEQLDNMNYTVRARSIHDDPADAPQQIDQITFPKDPDVYIQAILDVLDQKTQAGLTPEEFDDEVAKIGKNLYAKLFHEDGFKKYYWNHLANLPTQATLQIVSDEPYIPWEILRPSQRQPNGIWRSEPLYLCERFALSRWLSGPSLAAKLPLSQVVLVAPPSNLPFVQQEVSAIQGLTDWKVKILADKPTLEAFLQTGQTDILHFACHGRFQGELPGRSAIRLHDRFFRPDDLTAENCNFAQTRPLVFLNACETARLGIGLTGLDGWAEAFLKAEVGFFIGSIWKTTDEHACKFAEVFYQKLLEDYPIAEATRKARQAIKRPGDASYLSYTLYANPCIRAILP